MGEKNLSDIKIHWEKPETISLKDNNLQLLERSQIVEFIRKAKKKTLKDIGCGDGSDTKHFASHCEHVFAYDYSSAMLEKASINLNDSANVTLNLLNLLEDDLDQKSDLVITKRVLINLGNFENQKKAINKIYNSLNEGGYYILLETSIDGLENLNNLRTKFGLDSIPEPFHNTMFKLDELKDYLRDYFTIQEIEFFSTYFFLTRVYNPLLKNDDYFKYDVYAKDVAQKTVGFFESNIIGPQFCMLLKKK